MLLDFELDPQIIHHIIHSQAGTMAKAAIELVMNSVDAGAKNVILTITNKTICCTDDGNGFVTRDDVLRYFGRFGTPHADGDATYGRFRLGRGQIMAYARTQWVSNYWQMDVDTLKWGYKYELNDLDTAQPGCSIQGEWYDELSDIELLSTCQEIRDLIRYTPVQVTLNEKVISKNPAYEKWDAEDEFAYYRVKAEGAVSIYNQGVLVRHDSGHIWGAGGMIVSKKAIDLNVSRTEILRKTCPVWKHISGVFQKMADQYVQKLGNRRKTEARREKAARSLLAGAENLYNIFHREEVITVLPGKRHITLCNFLQMCRYKFKCQTTVITSELDVPKGEAIAGAGISQVIHWSTLDRFGCHSITEFSEALERIGGHLKAAHDMTLPTIKFMDFGTLKDAYVERTSLVKAKDVLDKETLRLWTALAWCLSQYAALSSGGSERYYGGRVYGGTITNIFLGRSDSSDGWTDGETYIAINEKIVQGLKAEPMPVASRIFAILDHEIAHEGDSLESGHDEAFYQRFHDQVLRQSEKRQWYIRMFLRKYVTSLEGEGKRMKGNVYREVWLEDRAGTGRKAKGLPSAYGDNPITAEDLNGSHDEDAGMIALVNSTLPLDSSNATPDWETVKNTAVEQLRADEVTRRVEWEIDKAMDAMVEEQDAEWDAMIEAQAREWEEHLNAWLTRLASFMKRQPDGVEEELVHHFAHSYPELTSCNDEQLRADFEVFERLRQTLSQQRGVPPEELPIGHIIEMSYLEEENGNFALFEAPAAVLTTQLMDRRGISPENQHLVKHGETEWTLERNAAAAGFYQIEEYLHWRSDS
ncbi:TPA: ATP-binding protein [Klebsiella aerogenes]